MDVPHAMSDDDRSKAEIRIGNVVAEMKDVVEFVDGFGRDNGLFPTITNELNLCLDEVLNNTISYGYDDGGRHTIRVALSIEDNVLIAEVEDDARPFDLRHASEPNVSGGLHTRKLGGLGIHFVKSLMDSVDYARSDGYNRLTLRKKIPSAG
jgi:anti-sigma regulatory factor (Ser/Thr protein kinase)